MNEFDLIFKCRGDGCSAQLTLNRYNRGFPIVICPECERLLELHSTGGGGSNPTFHHEWVRCEVRILHDEALRKIPEDIVRTIKEAVRCLGSGSNYACVAMCRRVVEGIVVTKGAHGRTLKDKITNLGNRHLISERVEWGDGYVRSLGNIACHFEAIPKNEITRADAEVCLSMAYEITKEVFLGADALTLARDAGW